MQIEIKGLSVGENRINLSGKRAVLGRRSGDGKQGKENWFHARHHSPEAASSTTRSRRFSALKTCPECYHKVNSCLTVDEEVSKMLVPWRQYALWCMQQKWCSRFLPLFRASREPSISSRVNTARPPAGFQQPMQVAAVCYRLRGALLEFLLVNTSAGKWTFPKGNIDDRLSMREAAAREALEEAGAKGRIEEIHFDCYLDTKRSLGRSFETREILVAAYLFEVSRLGAPEEAYRNPTWFVPREAKTRLAERRSAKYRDEMTRIVDGAIDRLVGSDRGVLYHYLGRHRRLSV